MRHVWGTNTSRLISTKEQDAEGAVLAFADESDYRLYA